MHIIWQKTTWVTVTWVTICRNQNPTTQEAASVTIAIAIPMQNFSTSRTKADTRRHKHKNNRMTSKIWTLTVFLYICRLRLSFQAELPWQPKHERNWNGTTLMRFNITTAQLVIFKVEVEGKGKGNVTTTTTILSLLMLCPSMLGHGSLLILTHSCRSPLFGKSGFHCLQKHFCSWKLLKGVHPESNHSWQDHRMSISIQAGYPHREVVTEQDQTNRPGSFLACSPY